MYTHPLLEQTVVIQHFRSTTLSRPKYLITLEGETNVRPSSRYVRPQKVCPISMKFGMHVEVDE